MLAASHLAGDLPHIRKGRDVLGRPSLKWNAANIRDVQPLYKVDPVQPDWLLCPTFRRDSTAD